MQRCLGQGWWARRDRKMGLRLETSARPAHVELQFYGRQKCGFSLFSPRDESITRLWKQRLIPSGVWIGSNSKVGREENGIIRHCAGKLNILPCLNLRTPQHVPDLPQAVLIAPIL